jgi:hypothetical protein
MTVNVEQLQGTLADLKNNIAFWNQAFYVHPTDVRDEFWTFQKGDGYPSDSYIAWEKEILPDPKASPLVDTNECKTAYCFAGFAALRNDFPKPNRANVIGGYWSDPRTGKSVDDFAREVLGLSWSQAYGLFQGDNTLEHIEFIVGILSENPNMSDNEFNERVREFINDGHPLSDEDDEDYEDEDYDED